VHGCRALRPQHRATQTSTTLPEALVAGPRSRCARDDAAGSCLSLGACQRLESSPPTWNGPI
jgi:hypothetical protein